jgi:dihydroxy-acid dehydratase
MAGRVDLNITLDDFDRLSRDTPLLANIRPAGRFLMEDFHNAGGLPALLKMLSPRLALDCRTVNGTTLGEQIAAAECYDGEVIRSLENPLRPDAGTCVLRGNLAPDGCVIKGIAADPDLLTHRGPALVFDDYPSLKAKINDPDLPVTRDTVLVLRSAGPLGAPGMPEWGMLPIPQKLLAQGVRDMVRISDARMSGTSYGACVLHVSPESWVGGPLALVQDGDIIELNVPQRQLLWHVSAAEEQRRRAEWKAKAPRFQRGYGRLYEQHASQANHGCDFDFLGGRSPGCEPDIF